MSLCFKYVFMDIQIIIDCIGIPLMKFKKCNKFHNYIFQYKSTYTAKYMTEITPGGVLSFITPAYGGQTSDKFIFENSELLKKLEDGDAKMANKGFLIDNIYAQKHIKLYRPPFIKGKTQLSQDDTLLNVCIASVRLHIERVNPRIKIFNVLNKFPTSLMNELDAIF